MNLTIQMPDGSQRVLAVDDPDIPLSDCLFQAGIQLKTRCGGRGLCLGCEVTSLGHGVVKSCQVPAKQFAQTTITIPGKSLADNNVHALCAFDVVTPNGIERLKRSGLGLAIDIGTTTLAAGIWDLMSGACLAVASLGNPQRRFGDDVLSRISFAFDKADGGRQLQHCLVAEGLVPLFRNLAAALSAHQPILAACVVGNPTMLHGLTGDSLAGFSRFPFAPVFANGRVLPAGFAQLPWQCETFLLPAAGAFVGADVTAGAVATGLLDEHRVTLLIDFGTNGEMVLSSPNAVLATATAAGPAFEGGRLSCGTTARPGAISSLDLNASLGWHCHRQGACAARDFVGITGSAYVDFLALTSQCELLSALGRFNRQHPLWCKSGRMVNGLAALFVDENHFVSEADIAELLQAKAAIGSGIAMLLRRARLNVSDIEQLLIAGGFGYYLNPSHAAYIGLLPNLPLQRIRIPGNAALAGASIALQYNLTLPIQQWLSRVQCIELNSEPEFANLFSDCLALEPL